MKISDITNIEGIASGGMTGIRWEAGDSRYHIWLDTEGRITTKAVSTRYFPCLYKNPLTPQPGYASRADNQTKYLDAMNNANAGAVHFVMAEERRLGLIEYARNQAKAAEALSDLMARQQEAGRMRLACEEFRKQEQGKGYDEALNELCDLPDESLITLGRIFGKV